MIVYDSEIKVVTVFKFFICVISLIVGIRFVDYTEIKGRLRVWNILRNYSGIA